MNNNNAPIRLLARSLSRGHFVASRQIGNLLIKKTTIYKDIKSQWNHNTPQLIKSNQTFSLKSNFARLSSLTWIQPTRVIKHTHRIAVLHITSRYITSIGQLGFDQHRALEHPCLFILDAMPDRDLTLTITTNEHQQHNLMIFE